MNRKAQYLTYDAPSITPNILQQKVGEIRQRELLQKIVHVKKFESKTVAIQAGKMWSVNSAIVMFCDENMATREA